MNKLQEIVKRLYCVKGQGLVEYMLVLVLVAVVIVFMLTVIGQNLHNTYAMINSRMP